MGIYLYIVQKQQDEANLSDAPCLAVRRSTLFPQTEHALPPDGARSSP